MSWLICIGFGVALSIPIAVYWYLVAVDPKLESWAQGDWDESSPFPKPNEGSDEDDHSGVEGPDSGDQVE